MKIIIQRVSSASVTVNQEIVAQIDSGILALIGLGEGDDNSKFAVIIEKIINMRIFSNPKGRFDNSLLDINGGVILVPQFTLYADTSKGRRPEFFKAMPPQLAKSLFEEFCEKFKSSYPYQVETGVFGADMKVALLNDGPVTIPLEFPC